MSFQARASRTHQFLAPTSDTAERLGARRISFYRRRAGLRRAAQSISLTRDRGRSSPLSRRWPSSVDWLLIEMISCAARQHIGLAMAARPSRAPFTARADI